MPRPLARALFVDDSELFLQAMRRHFGEHALVACSVAEGLSLARDFGPCAIILDEDVPGGPGSARVELFRRASPYAAIIMHSAVMCDAAPALDGGAIVTINKPKTEQLIRVVTALLNVRQSGRAPVS